MGNRSTGRCRLPLTEPVARYGPFVINTQAEMRQAIEDYRQGRMGAITLE
jgi:redox-sensitive bicupin YhaK (pirin superfamily)